MPITETGYQRRTLDVVLTAIQASLRGKISPKLDLTEKAVLGNTSNIDADHIDQLEQLVEEAYNAFDPDNASDDRFVAISLLSGVPRRGPQKGLVTVNLNLDASQSYAPGDLAAHVIDEPTNRWLNRDAVVSTSAGTYPAVFQSELAGSAAIAEAGTLTVIATPVSGWNDPVTNPAAATPGQDIESIPALRIRRESSLATGGSRTRGAIRRALVLLDGVLSAEVFDNTSGSTDANGVGAHSVRAVVWDGSPAAANNAAIAQAIWDHKAEGILSQGAQSGTAQDETLGPVTVFFDRASTSVVAVAVDIESTTGVRRDDIKAAILAQMPGRVGQGVIFNRLASSVFSVAGVDNRGAFTINGAGLDLPPVQNRIYLLDASDITVTGDVT
ncbi:MAG TPA: baseplate J/gp47 family protein [Gaiellaceae bacterium]